ncbi:MAG TPA: nuclear transport factor 2 family protein [Gammaproteobacteria bacterium]
MIIHHQPITGLEKITSPISPYSTLVEFYSAFNHQNFQQMKNNWLQSSEASMSNPLGGLKRGWNEISNVYDKIFNGNANVYVEYYDYSIEATDTMFYAAGRERGFIESGKEKFELDIRTTRIYRFINNQWRQVHHHGSMDNPVVLAKYQSLVLEK